VVDGGGARLRAEGALSHTSAGELWGMLRSDRLLSPAESRRPGDIHVTVPSNARQRRGIRVHRSGTLFPSQVTRRERIPVTTPSRTLADLRRVLPQPQFAAALRQAEFLGLPLEPRLEADHTRSELEARFLSLCRRHRLPRPEANVPIGPFTVDCLWRDCRLVVELDGHRAHGSRAAFEADRERDAYLTRLGFSVVRLTWRQVTRNPADVTATLRQVLRMGANSDGEA
jgi:very-short-patch-repair endonuclease